MATEDYISFETAKLLKEKGFDYASFYCYEEKGDDILTVILSAPLSNSDLDNTIEPHKCYSAPTLQMTMKWLREEKGIAVIPVLSSVLDNEKFLWDIKIVVAETNDTYPQGWVYEKQEDACKAAIKYCLENLI